MLDLSFIRDEILNKGYYIFKNFASSDECILLRDTIEKKLKLCPEYNERINSDTMPDYSHKRSHDKNLRTIRYYSFYHNCHKWSNIENKILKKGLDLRNKIEEEWVQNLEYKKIKSSLQNYNIFTKYIESTGMLKPHRDYPKKLAFPLLQFNLILSEQKKDFTFGEFIFEDYKKNTLKIHNDLNMSIGDALLFDKYLLHSVELTHGGLTGIGRWSVLVGARADKISFFKEKKIRLKYKLKNLLK